MSAPMYVGTSVAIGWSGTSMRRVDMAAETPSHTPECGLTVVVPVLNEAEHIGEVLEQLSGQAEPPGGFEVLVADGGSTDETREICRRHHETDARVRLLDNPNKLSGAGRNVGAREARGRYVVFLDGHCEVPRSDYLQRCFEIFEQEGADCLCRPQSLLEMARGEWETAIALARHSWFGHNPGSSIYEGRPGWCDPKPSGAAYRRSCLEELGGYDERFDACEDVEFNCRVEAGGYRSFWHTDLGVHYRPRSSLRGLFSQMIRYGRGRGRLVARHPRVVPWPLLVALVYAALLLSALIWSGVSAFVGLSLASGVIWSTVAGLVALQVGSSPAQAWKVFLSFGAIHLGLLIGFARGLLDFRAFLGPPPSNPGD